jgi:hypothetical protein
LTIEYFRITADSHLANSPGVSQILCQKIADTPEDDQFEGLSGKLLGLEKSQ